MTQARRGFFPFIIGERVSLRQGGALVLGAMDNLQVTQGGGQVIGAGNSITVSRGGGWLVAAGASVSIDQGGAGLVGARQVRADRTILGLALGQRVEISDSRVLLGSGPSLILGAVLGLLLGSWFGRRKP